MRTCLGIVAAILVHAALSSAVCASEPAGIRIIDKQTGRGIPLVELRTTAEERFVTDNAGLVAITAPELIGERVFFHIESHGYEFPKDGFGISGRALDLKPGEIVSVEMTRTNVAERLYRQTGSGLYRDSVLLGQPTPLEHPLGQAKITGCDSVMTALYRGRIYWFWGDTNRLAYPLGNFHITGATSAPPSDGGLDPRQGVNLDYFTQADGFVKPMAKMPGDGPTWISSPIVLKDDSGQDVMYAPYAKIRGSLEAYAWGLCRWNDEKQEFEHVTSFDHPALGAHIQDHPLPITNEDGTQSILLPRPFPLARVAPTPEALADPKSHDGFTCLIEGSSLSDPQIDRDAEGRIRYAWKCNTPFLTQRDQDNLIAAGQLREQESLIQLQDVATGRKIVGHTGSVAWNAYRQRYVMIVVELGGESSMLGNVWYAEADTPVGPWTYASMVVTHNKYTFYNPKHHAFFDQLGGRRIFFEGTYTRTFSNSPIATQRYDYNQVLYSLDLDDSRVNLPRPVAVIDDVKTPPYTFGRPDYLTPFYALDRFKEGSVAIGYTDNSHAQLHVVSDPTDTEAIIAFYALPSDMRNPPPTTTPLYEFVHKASGGKFYSVDKDRVEPGYERGEILCRVWKNPASGIGVLDWQ
jgi:hypothetical protein